MDTNFFKQLVKQAGEIDTYFADDGLSSSEFSGFIDTGSYMFNALLSGSMYGGLPNNKITAIAGESATGKTFFALGIMKKWLDDNPTGAVFYYDTEAAVTKSMMQERGIDVKRVIIAEMTTVQQFRTHAMRVLDAYVKPLTATKEAPHPEKPPIMFILDSLGMLSTEKEVADIQAGNDTRDMTRSQLIRGTFRAISLRLAKAKAPFILTNHTYAGIGQYAPAQSMGGGGGVKYAASQIIFLSKKKDKEGEGKDAVQVGNIIHCKTEKSRLTKEGQRIDVRLRYDTGLDRWHGVFEMALEGGIIVKEGQRYRINAGPDLHFRKHIDEDPAKYFTKDVMDRIEDYCKTRFLYGQGAAAEDEDESATE